MPPEARTWRHPSELQASHATVAAVLSGPESWRRGTAFVVGTMALAAIVFGALLLVNTGSTPVSVDADSMPIGTAAVTQCCTLSPALARDAVQAVVSIGPARPAATSRPAAATSRPAAATTSRPATTSPLSSWHGASGCGVVVGDGIVATTVAALDGARRVRVVSATGRSMQGEVIATDHVSQIVLLRLSGTTASGSLPVLASSQVEDPDLVSPGMTELAVAMQTAGARSAPTAKWSSGTVTSVGEPGPAPGGTVHGTTTVTSAGSSAIAQISVNGPSVPAMPGEPLIDKKGRMVGILDGAQGAQRSFLPMSFVMGVANELETLGRVRHGWLGVTDTTPQGGRAGALVVWVDPRGAAAGALHPGDVIVRVDGRRVHSSADLRSMLYAMSPGTRVTLQATRGTRVVRAVVELAPSP